MCGHNGHIRNSGLGAKPNQLPSPCSLLAAECAHCAWRQVRVLRGYVASASCFVLRSRMKYEAQPPLATRVRPTRTACLRGRSAPGQQALSYIPVRGSPTARCAPLG